MSDTSSSWCVYILECADGSYYTGCTNNLPKRVANHNAGTGAKYTRSHLPVKLVYSEECSDRSMALKREIELKKLTHSQKKALVDHNTLSCVCKAHISA
jgi:putative endonuclease